MKQKLTALALFLAANTAAFAYDTFDAATGTLTIPLVSAGGTMYKNVQVTVSGVKSVGGIATVSVAPLQDALRLVYSTPQQSTYKYSGALNGKPINGSTLTSISAVSSASFEGKNVSLVTRTRKNLDANGNELSNSTTQVFLDKNLAVLGEIDQYYRVVTSSSVVGGVLVQTENVYDTAAKQNLYAVNNDSFYAEADPADPTKILLYESGEGKDAAGNLTNTWSGIYSIDVTTGFITNKFYSSFGKSSTVIYFTH